MTFYDVMWIFVVYAFLGWCTEVVFQAAAHGKFINRGFLNGPVCPIYGFGVLIVILLLTPLKDSFILLFFGSVILTSALEFITGFVLEKFFHDKWWDYSKEHFNIKGYVCLRFSLAWGAACVIVVDTIHPLIMGIIGLIPGKIGMIIVLFFLALMAADAAVTVSGTIEMSKRMRRMEELARKLHSVSDRIGESLAGGAIDVKAKLEDNKGELDELKAKYKELAEKKSFTQKRLMKSFPSLQTGHLKNSIERKVYKIQLDARDRREKQREAAEDKESLRGGIPLYYYRGTLEAVVEILEARDRYTANHSKRVAEMCLRFSRALGLGQMQTETVEMTGAIHDIGKIGISDAVLNHSGRLTESEWDEVKSHPGIGADIIMKIGKMENIAANVRCHHERWDGGGYPKGLCGTEIPLCSRIISLCDSVDAMMSDRVYRRAMTPEECRIEIRENAGKMYQPELAELFLKNWDGITAGLYEIESKTHEKVNAEA